MWFLLLGLLAIATLANWRPSGIAAIPSRGGPAVPGRVRWAVDLLDPRRRAHLEIRGGPGAAAVLICERLTPGWLLMIDRLRSL